MKFFDLEMSGLAAGFAKKGGDIHGAISFKAYNADLGKCQQEHYSHGTSNTTCGLESRPGKYTTAYVSTSYCAAQK